MRRSYLSCVAGLSTILFASIAAAETATDSKPARSNAPPAAQAPEGTNVSQGVWAADPQTAAAISNIEKALEEPTELEVIEAPLTDVIEYLKKKHRIEIQLDSKALNESGVATDTQVTRNLKGITLRSALRLVLRDLELTYVVRDQVLLITTVSNSETIMTVKVYLVDDLLNRAAKEELRPNPASDLIDAITGSVAPTTWDEVGGAGGIKYMPVTNSLIISQTQEVHDGICDLLTAMRKVRVNAGAQPTAGKAAKEPNLLFVVTYWLQDSPAVRQLAEKPALADLARAVPKIIEPTTWRENGGEGVIASIGVGVVVRQSRAVHLKVEQFLRTVGCLPANMSEKPAERGGMGGGMGGGTGGMGGGGGMF